MADEPRLPDGSDSGERIAKRIARAGIASRREAERLIAEGRVTVDGATVASPALNVTAEAVIAIDGAPIPKPARTRLWRYHKPRERLVSRTDPHGRPTIYQDLPKELARAISVGRLDFNSEGLLLLTNDGELARKLELPSEGLVRRYRARAFGHVDQRALDRLKMGITVDGIQYGPIEARLEEARGANAWIALALTEGKNREVRKVLAALNLKVNRLIRTTYGPYALGDLPTGAVAEVPAASLMRDIGFASAKPKGWAKAKPRSKSKGKQRPGKNVRMAARKAAGERPQRDPADADRPARGYQQRAGAHRPGGRRPSGNLHRTAAPDRSGPAGDRNRAHAKPSEGPRRDEHRHPPKPRDNRFNAAHTGDERPHANRRADKYGASNRSGPNRSGPRGPHRGPNADRRR